MGIVSVRSLPFSLRCAGHYNWLVFTQTRQTCRVQAEGEAGGRRRGGGWMKGGGGRRGEALLFGESFAGSPLLCRSCRILSGFIRRTISFSTSLLPSHYSSFDTNIYFPRGTCSSVRGDAHLLYLDSYPGYSHAILYLRFLRSKQTEQLRTWDLQEWDTI